MKLSQCLQCVMLKILYLLGYIHNQLNRSLSPSRTFAEEESRPSTPNLSTDLNTSLVTRGKHVHFAPDLNSILSELDEESVVSFLQQQRDLSADIKKELEISLKRLKQEAHELLDLSAKISISKSTVFTILM